MNITGTSVRYELSASANTTSVNTLGSATIGTSATALVYEAPMTIAASYRMLLRSGESIDWDFINHTFVGGDYPNAGARQVETATIVAAGGITVAGDLMVTVTGSLIAGSPLVVPVPVSLADNTATMIAATIVTKLRTIPAITDFYVVDTGFFADQYNLLSKNALSNDATLNIAHANGTCDGVTAAATSSNTITGEYPVIVTRINGLVWDGTDFQGTDLPSMYAMNSVLFRCVKGLITAEQSGSVPFGFKSWAGSVVMYANTDGTPIPNVGVVTFTALADSELIVDYQGS